MSYVVMPKADWQDILNSVRAKTGKSGSLVSGAVPAEIDSIGGMGDFWDKFQVNGQRRNYIMAFAAWDPRLFTPKYNMNCLGEAQYMFSLWNYYHPTGVTYSMKQRLIDLGITLSFRDAINVQYLFYRNSCITELPELDFTGVSASTPSCVGSFYRCDKLITIDKITLSPLAKCDDSTFYHCDNLQNIAFEPECICFSIKFQHSSKLTPASIESIVRGLSPSASGQSCTINGTAVNNYISSEGRDTWFSLIAERSNWSIVSG